MKYLKTFKLFEETAKQLKMFPGRSFSEYKKSADILSKKFKSDKVQEDSDLTINDAIKKYGDYNELFKDYILQGDNEDETNEVFSYFLRDNIKILIEYICNNPTGLLNNLSSEYYPDIEFDVNNYTEDELKSVCGEILRENYMDNGHELLWYLENDGLLDSYDMIKFIENEYLESINFEAYSYTEYFDSLLYALSNSEDGKHIKIYRMIDIPNDEDDLIKHLDEFSGVGQFWSYDMDGAVAHCGGLCNSHSVVLIANVSAGNINWKSTFHKSVYSLKEEREIEVLDYVTVELEGIVLNSVESKLYQLKSNEIQSLTKMFNLSNDNVHELSKDIRKENEKKSTIWFDEPIVVSV